MLGIQPDLVRLLQPLGRDAVRAPSPRAGVSSHSVVTKRRRIAPGQAPASNGRRSGGRRPASRGFHLGAVPAGRDEPGRACRTIRSPARQHGPGRQRAEARRCAAVQHQAQRPRFSSFWKPDLGAKREPPRRGRQGGQSAAVHDFRPAFVAVIERVQGAVCRSGRRPAWRPSAESICRNSPARSMPGAGAALPPAAATGCSSACQQAPRGRRG